jgi:hypothetical protein
MGNVALSCSGASGLFCSFNPGSLQLAAGGTQTVVTILATTTAFAADGPFHFARWLSLGLLLPCPLIGFRRRRLLHFCLVASCAIWICSCGGSGSSGTGGGGGSSPPSSYTLQLTGGMNGVNRNLGTINVTVNH